MDVVWTKQHMEIVADTLLHAITARSDMVEIEKDKTIKYKSIYLSIWGSGTFFLNIAGSNGVYRIPP